MSPLDPHFKNHQSMLPSLPENDYDGDARPRLLHMSSFSGSIRLDKDAPSGTGISNPCPSPRRFRRPSTASSRSASHIRSYLDFAFQSFSVPPETDSRPSTPMSLLHGHPPSLPPLPSLSQPLFPPSNSHKQPLHISTFCHPNSPYVPWESPMRREFLRPLTPHSFVSHFSGFSRTGAIAPEPWEHEPYRPTPLMKLSHSIRRLRRSIKSVKRNMSNALTSRKKPKPSEGISPPIQSEDVCSILDEPLHPPRRITSVTSLSTTHTNSLAAWLHNRHQATLERAGEERHMMTLEEYERIGSWIAACEGGFNCGVEGCQFHPHVSPLGSEDETSSDGSSVMHSLDDTSDTSHEAAVESQVLQRTSTIPKHRKDG